jgi:hypothetical protein
MLSRIRNGPILSVEVDRLHFRRALVIEDSTILRSSIVQLLKRRGWIAHGSRIASQALPLLKCIPYHLIVILAELETHGRWNRQSYAN